MLRDLLVQQRRQILDRWTERVFDAYPREAAPFLKAEKDRFRNPVGYTIEAGLARIYDGLVDDVDEDGIEQAVEDIVRMRAVQEFSPSKAVGFAQPLKEVIGEMIKAASRDSAFVTAKDFLEDLCRLGEKIDRVTLCAVDCYVRCREKVFHTSLKEARVGGMVAAATRNRRVD
jgi:hypothetical protein